jgi:hypothetical protein
MQLLAIKDDSFSYIGDDHNYYLVFLNEDCGAPSDAHPMRLGPFQAQERCVDLPF